MRKGKSANTDQYASCAATSTSAFSLISSHSVRTKRETRCMPSGRGKGRSAKAAATAVTGPFADVQRLVARIPRGKVVTYGQLSQWIDGRLTPIGVSWALRAGAADLPWHRVVNSAGKLSTEREEPGLQRARLEAEGVQFVDGAIDLLRYGWRG